MASVYTLDQPPSQPHGPRDVHQQQQAMTAPPPGPAQTNGHRRGESSVLGIVNSEIIVTALLTRLKQSISSCRDFAEFLKRRAVIEDEQATALRRLCKATQVSIRKIDTRQGTFSKQMDEMTHLHARLAENGFGFALALNQLHDELSELVANMERDRRQYKQVGLNADRRAHDAEIMIEKAKAKYDGLAEDFERVRTGDRRGKSFGFKGRSGAQQEEELQRKLAAAAADYEGKVHAATAQHHELVSAQRPMLVKSMHEMIHECDSALTLYLQKYGQLTEQLVLQNGRTVSPLPTPDAPPHVHIDKGLRAIISLVSNEADFTAFLHDFAAKNPVTSDQHDIKFEPHPALVNLPPAGPPLQPYPPQQPQLGKMQQGPPVQMTPQQIQQMQQRQQQLQQQQMAVMQQQQQERQQQQQQQQQPPPPPQQQQMQHQQSVLHPQHPQQLQSQQHEAQRLQQQQWQQLQSQQTPPPPPQLQPPQLQQPSQQQLQLQQQHQLQQHYQQLSRQQQAPPPAQQPMHPAPLIPGHPLPGPPTPNNGLPRPQYATSINREATPPQQFPTQSQGGFGAVIQAPAFLPVGMNPPPMQRREQDDETFDLPRLRPVFGVPLEELLIRDDCSIPIIMCQCIQAVDLYGLDSEGIYRKPGEKKHVDRIQLMFDNDATCLDFRRREDFFHDVNSVASVLKQFLRDLPEPLLTNELYEEFVVAARIDDNISRRDTLHGLINRLPDPNYAALRMLIVHLNRVVEHSNKNRMTPATLATFFGPTLLGSRQHSSIVETNAQVRAIETVLENCFSIFHEE